MNNSDLFAAELLVTAEISEQKVRDGPYPSPRFWLPVDHGGARCGATALDIMLDILAAKILRWAGGPRSGLPRIAPMDHLRVPY